MDPEPKLVRYGSGRYVPTLVGDPGPVPPEQPRRRGPYDSDEEPCIALLIWIFEGMNISERGGYKRIKKMTGEERIAWMRSYMPKTYALLSFSHCWEELFG